MKQLILFFLIFSFHSHAQDTIPAIRSVIALDKMNVVYRGVENPLSIAVNDVKSYIIYGDGVSKNKEGKYILSPGSGNETKVFVEIENFDGSKVIEEHVFRVLPFGPHYFTINDFRDNGNLVFYIEDLKDAKIEAKIKDFLFPINLEVKGFDIKFPRNKTLAIEGYLLTDEVYELLKNTRKKDIIIISNIRWKHDGLNGIFRTSPIVFKVNKKNKNFYFN
ncbi:MAG: GldM family protein [Flavobacterium sp.]